MVFLLSCFHSFPRLLPRYNGNWNSRMARLLLEMWWEGPSDVREVEVDHQDQGEPLEVVKYIIYVWYVYIESLICTYILVHYIFQYVWWVSWWMAFLFKVKFISKRDSYVNFHILSCIPAFLGERNFESKFFSGACGFKRNFLGDQTQKFLVTNMVSFWSRLVMIPKQSWLIISHAFNWI